MWRRWVFRACRREKLWVGMTWKQMGWCQVCERVRMGRQSRTCSCWENGGGGGQFGLARGLGGGMQRQLPLLINKSGASGTKRRPEGCAHEAMDGQEARRRAQ